MSGDLPFVGAMPLDENAGINPAATASDAMIAPYSGAMPLAEPPTAAAPKGSFWGSFGTGTTDPLLGLGQLSAHLGIRAPEEYEALAMSGASPMSAADIDKMISQREADYQATRQPPVVDTGGWGKYPSAGFDWARLAGNVASPINFVPGMGAEISGASIPARLALAAGRGALFGAEQPVTNGDFAANKALQTGAGAVVGPIGELAAPLVRGAVSAPIQALQDLGVNLTAAQKGGLVAKSLAAVTPNFLLKKGQNEAIESFSRGAYNNALFNMGERLPEGVSDVGAASQTAQDILSGGYDDLLSKPDFQFAPNTDPSGTFLNKVADVAQSYTQAYPERANAFYSKIAPVLQDNLSGDALKSADARVGGYARSALGNNNTPDQDLGSALADVRQAFRDDLGRVNPQYQDRLDALDKTSAMLRAADLAAKNAQGQFGAFTPYQLMRAGSSMAGNSGAGVRQVVQGDALQQPYAQAGQKIIGSSRGTNKAAPLNAGHLIALDLLGGLAGGLGLSGAGAAGIGMSENGPDWLKYGAYASPLLLATPPGRAALSALGPGRAVRGLLGDLGAAAPSLGASSQFGR